MSSITAYLRVLITHTHKVHQYHDNYDIIITIRFNNYVINKNLSTYSFMFMMYRVIIGVVLLININFCIFAKNL